MLMLLCHQLLSGFLAKGDFSLVSLQSRLSANDKDENEMIPGNAHRSLDNCLTAEETFGKPQLGGRLMETVRPFIASNEVPYLQMRSIGSLRTSGGLKEGST